MVSGTFGDKLLVNALPGVTSSARPPHIFVLRFLKIADCGTIVPAIIVESESPYVDASSTAGGA